MRQKLSRSPRSRLSASEISKPRQTFVSYERKVTFHIISYQGEISLMNLSKCFFGNRDNFCLYEQALRKISISIIKITGGLVPRNLLPGHFSQLGDSKLVADSQLTDLQLAHSQLAHSQLTDSQLADCPPNRLATNRLAVNRLPTKQTRNKQTRN